MGKKINTEILTELYSSMPRKPRCQNKPYSVSDLDSIVKTPNGIGGTHQLMYYMTKKKLRNSLIQNQKKKEKYKTALDSAKKKIIQLKC